MKTAFELIPSVASTSLTESCRPFHVSQRTKPCLAPSLLADDLTTSMNSPRPRHTSFLTFSSLHITNCIYFHPVADANLSMCAFDFIFSLLLFWVVSFHQLACYPFELSIISSPLPGPFLCLQIRLSIPSS